MKVITASNPDDALAQGLEYLKFHGTEEPSRNGTVLVAPGPVTTVYPWPRQRVSYSALRDANPFFHLMEALWMLAGRNDVKFLAAYNSRMAEFSDDGATLHGAYGFRWREFFGYDQLPLIVEELRSNPITRRAVLSMWDGSTDLAQGLAAANGKDVPCNTHAYFRVRRVAGEMENVLDMTVCCRSNDIVWGAYGANVVQFSLLQEYLADKLGMGVGVYTQVSNNYHAYIERPDVVRLMPDPGHVRTNGLGNSIALGAELEGFDAALATFIETPTVAAAQDHPFLKYVAAPMAAAYAMHKEGRTLEARGLLVEPIDWHRAGLMWLERRLAKQPAVQEVR